MHHTLLIIHLLAATIWVGGHLILCVAILPAALKRHDPQPVQAFEKRYERIAIPSLLILVITGVWMSYLYGIRAGDWLEFSTPLERVISTKLLLLLATLILGSHGRIRILPQLTKGNLTLMALHIILITLLGIAMLMAGTFVRFGGF